MSPLVERLHGDMMKAELLQVLRDFFVWPLQKSNNGFESVSVKLLKWWFHDVFFRKHPSSKVQRHGAVTFF